MAMFFILPLDVDVKAARRRERMRNKTARELKTAEKRKRKFSTRRRSFFCCRFFWKQMIFYNWIFHFSFLSSSPLFNIPPSSSLSFLSVFSEFSAVFSSSPLTFSSSSFSSVLYPLSSFCRPLPRRCLPAAAACVEGLRVKRKKTNNQTGRWHSSFGFGEWWRRLPLDSIFETRRRCCHSSVTTWELHGQSAYMTGGRRRKGKKKGEGRYFFCTKLSAMFPDFHASDSDASYEFPYPQKCYDKDNSSNDDADAAWNDVWNRSPGNNAESSEIDDNVEDHHCQKKGWQVHPKWLEGQWVILHLSPSSYENVWWSLTTAQREVLPLMLKSIGAFVLKSDGHVELLPKRKKNEDSSEICKGVDVPPPQGDNSHSLLPAITSETSGMSLGPSISSRLFVSNLIPLRWNFTPATRRLIVEWATVKERLVFRLSVQLRWRTQRFVRGKGNGRLRSPDGRDGRESNEKGNDGGHCLHLQPPSSSFSPPLVEPEHSISYSSSFDFPPYPPPSFSCQKPSLHRFYSNVSPIIATVEIQKMKKDYQRQIVSERKRWWRMADVLRIQIDGEMRGRVLLSSVEKKDERGKTHTHPQMKQSIEKGVVGTDRMAMMIKEKQKMKEDFRRDFSQAGEEGKENEKTQKAIPLPHLSLEAAVERALAIPAVLAKLKEAESTMIETAEMEKTEEINSKGRGDTKILNDLFYTVGINPQLIHRIIYLPHKQILNLILQR